LNSYAIGKVILQCMLCTHINETQTAETPIVSWVDCYRFNISTLSMQVSLCVHST